MSHTKSVMGAILIATSILSATAAWAHHSYAMFDLTKVIDVKGTVKEFHYQNPHSWIVLMPLAGKTPRPEMTIEGNGPGYLVRNGWKRSSLNPGDVVTVSLNPLRDGSPGGSLVKVTFPDGRQLTTR